MKSVVGRWRISNCAAFDSLEAFPLPLTPDVLRSFRIQPHLIEFWQEWLERARQANIDQVLYDTVAQVLERERFEHSFAGRAMRMFVRRPLSAIGVTPVTAQADRRGALTRTAACVHFREMRRRLRS